MKPHGRGIVMYTLHHAAKIRSIDQVEELNSVASTVKLQRIKLARQVIEPSRGHSTLPPTKDEYREGLEKIIQAKIAGQEVVAPDLRAMPQVVNLMDALQKSLDAVSAGKKRPANRRLNVRRRNGNARVDC